MLGGTGGTVERYTASRYLKLLHPTAFDLRREFGEHTDIEGKSIHVIKA
jgi:hypothetical protein